MLKGIIMFNKRCTYDKKELNFLFDIFDIYNIEEYK